MKRERIYIGAICALSLLAAALCALCLHYGRQAAASNRELPALEGAAEAPRQSTDDRIQLSVEPEAETGLQDISWKEPMALGERHRYHSYALEYWGVSSVTVHSPEGDLELRQAVDSGAVSLAQLVAQAEDDAAQGLCEQWFSCGDLSLTWTIYRYPEYTMAVMNDMYETESLDEKYLYKYLVFAPAGADIGGPTTLKQDDESFSQIGGRDWELTVSARDVSPTGAVLHCTLSNRYVYSGAVYMGEIYRLSRKTDDGWETVQPLKDPSPMSHEALLERGLTVPFGGEADLPVSWEETYGALERGTYKLRIQFLLGSADAWGEAVEFTLP